LGVFCAGRTVSVNSLTSSFMCAHRPAGTDMLRRFQKTRETYELAFHLVDILEEAMVTVLMRLFLAGVVVDTAASNARVLLETKFWL